jgi:hypothetical protein
VARFETMMVFVSGLADGGVGVYVCTYVCVPQGMDGCGWRDDDAGERTVVAGAGFGAGGANASE